MMNFNFDSVIGSAVDSPSAGRYILPEFEEQTPNGGYRVQNPYSRLYKDRIIMIGTGIDEVVANDVISQLLLLQVLDSTAPITIYLNSFGGNIEWVSGITDTMKYVKLPITTILLGKADTAASLVLASGTPGQRAALEDSRVMLYQPQAQQGGRGQASDIEIIAKEYKFARKWVSSKLARLTNSDENKVDNDIERNLFMGAEEARAYGIIDKVVE